MRLQFDPDQPHQRRAMAATLGLVHGAPAADRVGGLAAGGDGTTVANVALPPGLLAANLHSVQHAQGLAPTDLEAFDDAAFPNLSVEMETGTGKTYLYLRTALELARAVGWRKFAIVVPSVAIREGVLKTLRVTAEHFRGLYPDITYRWFVYNSARLGDVRRFARSADVELMIITLDAFNKARNVVRHPSERLGGERPLSVLQRTRPVLIMDEPQNMESAGSRQALEDLHPLIALRYGATHRNPYARIHRLTPAQAHAHGLVKRVELCCEPGEPGTPQVLSRQIRATVETHLRRQAALSERGIKVLSLLFVDRVSSFADHDGVVRRLFDEHFRALRHLDPRVAQMPPEAVVAAYFAKRRRGRQTEAVDSKTGQSLADEATYALIMRDKERLLSLDEPVGFVVSHSALREGWDNPNVFQVCTLARSTSTMKKRQEIGRGARLCVDQAGRRIRDPAINVLTVVANASYEDYVDAWHGESAELEPGARAPDPGPAPRRPSVVVRTRARPEGWISLDTPALVTAAVSALDALQAPPGPGDGAVLVDVASEVRRWIRGCAGVFVTHATVRAIIAATRHRGCAQTHPHWIAQHTAIAIADRLSAVVPS